jgi:Ser/Thr protein kinase RdoA (MazF antagonist)
MAGGMSAEKCLARLDGPDGGHGGAVGLESGHDLRLDDFWPANWLWKDGRLTGVIDEENALTGPALADLAISRLDVAWALGFEAMEALTARYLWRRPLPTSELAHWDSRASRRPMANLPDWSAPHASLDRPDVTHGGMRSTLFEFIERALRRAAGA